MIRRVFKQANGVILVYDITNRKSFQLIPSWLKRLEEEIQSNIPKILIGNKKDLEK
jgi:GTPase SAR1 family protein